MTGRQRDDNPEQAPRGSASVPVCAPLRKLGSGPEHVNRLLRRDPPRMSALKKVNPHLIKHDLQAQDSNNSLSHTVNEKTDKVVTKMCA